MVIAFKKNSDPHFAPVISIVESGFVKSFSNTKESSTKATRSEPEIGGLQPDRPKIELLTRTEKSRRVFRPQSGLLAASEVSEKSKSGNLDSTGFIGFSKSDENVNQYKPTVIKFA